jgi:hypothetical protein
MDERFGLKLAPRVSQQAHTLKADDRDVEEVPDLSVSCRDKQRLCPLDVHVARGLEEVTGLEAAALGASRVGGRVDHRVGACDLLPDAVTDSLVP